MRTSLAAVCLVLSLAGACKREPAAVREAREKAAEIDKDAAELLAEPGHADAREWLAKPASMGFEVSTSDMSVMTEELYRRGALKVWVVGISTLGEREIAAVMVAELPASAEARRAVLEWYATIDEESGAPPDVGQRYLKIVLD